MKTIETAINIPFKNKITEKELLNIVKNKKIDVEWREHIEYLFTEVPSELFLLWCQEKRIELNDLKKFYEECLKKEIKNTWLEKLWEI